MRHLFLLSAVLSIATAVDVRSESRKFPPFEGTSKGVYFPGKIIWHELFTAKPDSSIAFYSGLFGWEISPLDESSDYYQATKDGYAVAGFIYREKVSSVSSDSNALWVSFISSPDVDAAVEKSLELGGTVLVEPKEFPDRGKAAIINHCCGNAIVGLVESARGDPGDYQIEIGEWVWTQLVSPNVEQEVDFCRKVFGYEIVAIDSTEKPDDFFLFSDNVTPAGLGPISDGSSEETGYWLGFIRVENLNEIIKKALSHGAKIESDPVLFSGGSLAVMSDPQGAMFGVIELFDTIAGGKGQ